MPSERLLRTLEAHGFGKEDAMNGNGPIVFATDGSPSALEARHEALELAKLLDAPLLVVSVAHAVLPTVGYAAYGYSDVVAKLGEAEEHRIEKLLDETAEAAAAAGVRCATKSADGVAVEEICRIAAERNARLIVVGSHGWGAARRFLSGSVSTGLVHSAPCPVLVVRPAAGAAERAAA
jgi:nucleotide-binding universal stress UspA family protein